MNVRLGGDKPGPYEKVDAMNGGKNEEYDTRKILEQMREEYWRGLSEAEVEEAKDLLQLVTVSLGGELFGIPAIQAKEILKTPELIRVPRTPSIVLGIFNLRGKITSVVDVRPILGLKQLEMGNRSRTVIVQAGPLTTGVVVENVREITQVPRGKIIPVARAIANKEYLTGQANLDGEIMVLLEMGKILSAKEFSTNA